MDENDEYTKAFNCVTGGCVPTVEMGTEWLNGFIKESGVDTNLISDGYHTFGELYEHRIRLFITLCNILDYEGLYYVWRSRQHSDGTKLGDWFVLGIGKKEGKQITYHLPDSKWEDCNFAFTLDRAPEFDGHTSDDVLVRLEKLLSSPRKPSP
jgi:hypothetical protein